jgi:hypothetical protein
MGRSGMGITELKQRGTNISVSLLDKDLKPETIRARINAKLSDFRPTDYQEMNPQELENLSKQAGRPLTQDQAMEFLKRQAAAGAVQQMLKGKGPLAGDGIEKDVKVALTNKGLLSPRMIESAVRAIRGQYNNFNDAYRAAMAIATKSAIESKKARGSRN